MSVVKMCVQKYAPGAYHPIHVHATDMHHYRFVFYIDRTEEPGATMFYNFGYLYVDHGGFKIKPTRGRRVLFPGAMPQKAMPSNDDAHMIVSGNIFYYDRKDAAPGP